MADDTSSGVRASRKRQGMEEIRFRVPGPWKRLLQDAADVQAIDLGDLMRLISRGFLRERYTAEQRAELGVD